MHIGEIELLLTLVRHIGGIFLAEELAQLTFFRPCLILFGSHQHRGIQIAVSYLRAYDIHARGVVIGHFLTNVLGEVEVDSRRVKIGYLNRCGLLNLPTGMKQRVGYLLIFCM